MLLLNGYTNKVYKIVTNKDKYILKEINELLDHSPFMSNEERVKKIINFHPIYIDEHIEIQHFIENKTNYNGKFKDLFDLNMLLALSQFNKIDSKKGFINLKYIFNKS